MEDDFLNIGDIEKMLSPQCEFHASKGLRDKVMNEARAATRRRHRLRFAPWLAAACVAGLLVIFLTTGNHTAVQKGLTSTHAVSGGRPDNATSAKTELSVKEKYIAAAPAERKPARARHEPKESPLTATTSETATQGTNAAENSSATVDADTNTTTDSLSDEQWATVISEADLPITCPENKEYTPEEIERLKLLAKQAYINWIRLEIEIASHNLQQTANIK